MTESELRIASPMSMTALCAFMERWKPQSTKGLRAATSRQISALAQFYGGQERLPPVYREFLATMGESMDDLRVTRGSTSISVLLEDLADRSRNRPDPHHYLKFSIGEDDYNGRHADDYFDVTRPTPDGADALILRIHEHKLIQGETGARRPFPTFSDLLRAVITMKVALDIDNTSTHYFDLGRRPEVVSRTFALLTRLGFTLTELGASPHSTVLEHPRMGAVALLLGPSDLDSSLQLRVDDAVEQRRLVEIITDHKPDLMKP